MVYLDTNIVLRYLLEDNEELSNNARKIIDSDTDLFICDGIFAEIVYVLSKVYKVERGLIQQTLTDFLEKANIHVSNIQIIKKSLQIFSQENIDYMDCILCSINHIEQIKIETFDNKLKKLLIQI